MRRALAVAAAIALAMTPVVTTAAKSAGATFGFGIQSPQFGLLVEQQTDAPPPDDQSLWVINPLRDVPCAWDVDDHEDILLTGGVIGAGQSFSFTGCMVISPTHTYRTSSGLYAAWTNAPGHWGVSVFSPSPALSVVTCYEPQHRCFTHTPIEVDGQYRFVFCSLAAYQNEDPMLAEVPGSQGGIGVVSQITTTISNPTSRRMGKIQGLLAISGQDIHRAGCGQPLGPQQEDYPFKWATGVAP